MGPGKLCSDHRRTPSFANFAILLSIDFLTMTADCRRWLVKASHNCRNAYGVRRHKSVPATPSRAQLDTAPAFSNIVRSAQARRLETSVIRCSEDRVMGSCLDRMVSGQDRCRSMLVEGAWNEWKRGLAAEVTMVAFCVAR